MSAWCSETPDSEQGSAPGTGKVGASLVRERVSSKRFDDPGSGHSCVSNPGPAFGLGVWMARTFTEGPEGR